MPGGIAEDPAVRPRLLRTLLIADPGTGRVLRACAIGAPSLEEGLARRFVGAAAPVQRSRPSEWRLSETVAFVTGAFV